jgi:membrane protein
MLEWRKQGERLWHLGSERLGWLGAYGRDWLFVTGHALQQTFGGETSMIASSIGYYTLMSLFPLILLTVAISSLWVDVNVTESELMKPLEFLAPGATELLGQNIESVVRARAPITGVAILLLLWSASNIFKALTHSQDFVWKVDLPWSQSTWRHRGLAMLLVLFTSIFVLMASLYSGPMVAILNSLYPEVLRPYRPYTTELWTMVVGITLFAILYRFLPHRKLSWRDVLPGAVVAGVVWEIVKRSFLSIIDVYLSRTNLIYGSLTTIIAFLTWTYVTSFIFLFGAYLNVARVNGKVFRVNKKAFQTKEDK